MTDLPASTFNYQHFFDEMYSRDGFSYADEPSWELKKLAGRIRTPASALDLGCGDGRAAVYLAQLGFSVTAVDISLVGLDKLARIAGSRGVGDRVETIHADVRSVDLPPESFHLITAVTILDHLPAAAADSTLDRWLTYLKPDGWLHMQVHLVDDPGNSHNGDPESESAAAGQHYFERGELRQVVEDRMTVENYREFHEEDTSHGPLHHHSFAELIARKHASQLRLL